MLRVASAGDVTMAIDAIATRSIKPAKAPERWTSPRRQRRGGQSVSSVRVGAQGVDRVAEPVEFALSQQDRATDLGQPLHVVGLVIVGRGCPRHQDRRGTGDGDLVHGAGATTADHHVAGLVDGCHVGLVADHLVLHGAVDVGRPRSTNRSPVI